MNPIKLFITGIDTEIGKTIVSAYFTHKLNADYWKPIQSGDLHHSDSMKVKALVENAIIHPERYALEIPASPCESAAKEGVLMRLEDFSLPNTNNNLVVEGAGGLFVPINSNTYMIDLIVHLQLPVVLVTRNYLGCINHTMLSIEALRTRGVVIDYLVFNGEFNPYSVEAIKGFADQTTQIITLPDFDKISKGMFD
ncbi:dethiobiotin synthase [Myroides marinus]|uniref:dethiobiotin synthase n=1 Tax=Myroides marinus TaxID=703342 RepID=UPI002574EC36|nr:dethiobiotin synthase [Myroides marinus]MDM1368304.1 dethiobiotin synthase [Myroides marinus]